MTFGDLVSFEVEHGVSEVGHPFVKVRATGDKTILLGQVEPQDAVGLAMSVLVAASRAEYEGDLFAGALAEGIGPEAIASVLQVVRSGESARMEKKDGGAA